MNPRKLIAERPWILAVAVALIVIIWMYSGVFVTRTVGPEPVVAGQSLGANALTRVQVRTQHAENIIRYIDVYGQTAPARSVELNAETDGRVESIGAERGERLKRGTVILRLDLRDRNARLKQAEASLNEQETAYAAQMKLQSEGYVSETQIAETLAKLEAAKTELLRARLDVDYMLIRAPFDGVLQEREVEVGDFVRAGDAVATFVDNTSIIVTGSVAEQDARFITLNETGSSLLATGQQVHGRIRYIAPVADQATRTFNVELEVENPDGSLPAGVTAQIQLPGGETLAQKLSPSLLTLDANGNVGIKVVDDLNRVVFYPVELAKSEPDGVWVSGLPDTARVITVGQGYVSPGQEVEAVMTQSETALAAEKLN